MKTKIGNNDKVLTIFGLALAICEWQNLFYFIFETFFINMHGE